MTTDFVEEVYGGDALVLVLGARAWTRAGSPLLEGERGLIQVDPDEVPREVLTGHRSGEGVRVELLDRDGGSRGTLDGVLGGMVEHNVHAIITGGGTLTVVRREGIDIDWLRDRVRVWWQVNGYEWPLGTFLPSAPTARYLDTEDGPLAVWDVELLDTATVLAEDALPEGHGAAAGSSITGAVVNHVLLTGERAAVTPSGETLTTAQVWPAGTTRLRVVNDLLATANYFSIRADGWGRLAAEPYRAPASRPTAWDFVPGDEAVHVAEMPREQDLYKIPNRVVLLTHGTEDEEALVAVATNDDPDSPYSTVARGRTITTVPDPVEASSQAVLQEMADRILEDASGVVAKIEVTHAVLPLAVNDVVLVEVDGVTRRGIVQSMATTLETGALTRTVLREVVE